MNREIITSFLWLFAYFHLDRYTYDTLQDIANHLLSRTQLRPKIGIILGTGLGSLANQLTDADYIDYETVPHFPVSTVEGHVGRLIFGYLKGVPVMCMQGRFHYYEGYPLAKVEYFSICRFFVIC